MTEYMYDACGDVASLAQGTVALPQITKQPVDQVVGAGDFASFSVVVAVTAGVTFQWAFNGTDIAGATGDSLLLPAVSAANAGDYTVTVTSSTGTVTSSPATLALDTGTGTGTPSAPPRLTAYSDVGGSVSVTPFRRSYDLAETVTLTATPTPPSVFVGWSGISTGDLIPTSNPVIVRMPRGDVTVRARFASPVPLMQGMVAFWRGENDATDLIGGHSGTFYAGTTPAAPSVTVWGKVGSAFAFDGTIYVQVPDAPGLRPAEMTAEAWVFPTVVSSIHQTVISRGSSTNDDDAWWMGVFNGNARFWSNHTGQGMAMLQSPAVIPLNQWTHLAISFDGNTKVLYVNGTQVASQSGLGPLIYDPAAIPVTIASDWTANASSQHFTGLIDEVSLYNRALTPAEVSGIVAAGPAGKSTAGRTS